MNKIRYHNQDAVEQTQNEMPNSAVQIQRAGTWDCISWYHPWSHHDGNLLKREKSRDGGSLEVAGVGSCQRAKSRGLSNLNSIPPRLLSSLFLLPSMVCEEQSFLTFMETSSEDGLLT